MVHLYYWKGKPNVGDYFSWWLATKLYKNIEYSDKPNLVITGSILSWPELSNNTIVWGAGLHNTQTDEFCRISDKTNFKAVRGKLTALKLGLSKNIILGDPGLLASLYFNPAIEPTKKYCMLTHWKDYDIVKKYYGSYVDVINMSTNDVEKILTKIKSYQLILSTSLHGLIFAHSYGKPALYVEANEPESKDYFKFKDYYSALDIDFTHYKLTLNWAKDLAYFNTLNWDILHPSKHCLHKIQTNLLACCPKEAELTKSYNTVICAIAKNENNYINDWVNYYLKLGIDHIYLFDNNDSTTEWVGNYISNKNKITIFNINNIHKEGLQLSCYNWFYNTYNQFFNWALFVDIDEFLTGIVDINKFVANQRFNKFEMIRIKWKLFGDDNKITRDKTVPIYKDITQEISTNPLSNQGKCMIRGKLANVCVGSCHYAYRNGSADFSKLASRNMEDAEPLLECLPSGKPTKAKISIDDYTNEHVFINHYMTKTISEFLEQKFNRGDACFGKRAINLEYFWKINKKTAEKLNYIDNFLSKEAIRTEPKKDIRADGQSNAYLYF